MAIGNIAGALETDLPCAAASQHTRNNGQPLITSLGFFLYIFFVPKVPEKLNWDAQKLCTGWTANTTECWLSECFEERRDRVTIQWPSAVSHTSFKQRGSYMFLIDDIIFIKRASLRVVFTTAQIMRWWWSLSTSRLQLLVDDDDTAENTKRFL